MKRMLILLSVVFATGAYFDEIKQGVSEFALPAISGIDLEGLASHVNEKKVEKVAVPFMIIAAIASGILAFASILSSVFVHGSDSKKTDAENEKIRESDVGARNVILKAFSIAVTVLAVSILSFIMTP